MKKKFQLGSLELSSPVFYAPLAGCSDYAFRKMSALYRPGLMYCEMVKMEPLVRNDPGTLRMLEHDQGMHPIGGQICGSKPELAGKAAQIVESLGFDVIDLNCGCPVDKVTKDGSGSAMLKTPNLIGDVIANMVAAVKVPVTVKIRAGWDEDHIVVAEVTQIAEKAGAAAICIHGRTRKQAYKGPAVWDYIKIAKEAAKNIKVIGNGDVLDGPSAKKIMEYTGCDAVLVARGTMGHPWAVEDILRHFEGLEPIKRSLEDCRKALYQHFLFSKNYNLQPKRTVIDMRRVGCWYLKRAAGTRAFREQISHAESLDQVEDLILNFPLIEGHTIDKMENESSDTCEVEPNKSLELHAIISGKVQGVGFRATTRHLAADLGLTGSVRNLPDGTVEIYAQGNRENLDNFLKNLKEHFVNHITSMQIEYKQSLQQSQNFRLLD